MNSAVLEPKLRRYRVMAWIVGVLLIVLVFVGVLPKYFATRGSGPQQLGETVSMYVGIAHGWLFMVYLVTTAILARAARWRPLFTITTMLAGLIPVFTFLAERRATRAVHASEHAG